MGEDKEVMEYKVRVFQEDPEASYEKLSELILSAFKERADAGLDFACCRFTPDVLKEYLEGKTTFVILDENDNYVATRSCQLKRDKKGRLFGRMYYLAVAISARRQGLSKKLLKLCADRMKAEGAEYLGTSTAVGAKSSVISHQKEGYRIVGYKFLKGTNYYSYIFEYDLTGRQMSRLELLKEKARYYKSYVVTRLSYRPDGTKKPLGKILG